MSRLFEAMHRIPFSHFPDVLGPHHFAKLDIVDTETEYLVVVDMPGVELEKISVELVNGLMTISAQRDREETSKSLLTERYYGAVTRSLKIPKNIDTSKIKSTLSNGVLTIHLPRLKDQNEQTTKISVSKL